MGPVDQLVRAGVSSDWPMLSASTQWTSAWITMNDSSAVPTMQQTFQSCGTTSLDEANTARMVAAPQRETTGAPPGRFALRDPRSQGAGAPLQHHAGRAPCLSSAGSISSSHPIVFKSLRDVPGHQPFHNGSTLVPPELPQCSTPLNRRSAPTVH